jgi:hypothetical protein
MKWLNLIAGKEKYAKASKKSLVNLALGVKETLMTL